MDLCLKQKIGALLMIGFAGNTPSGRHHIIRDIQQYNLGGVILFDKLLALGQSSNNITSPKDIARLTTTLQGLRPSPLLIAVDQEGGRVSRFTAQNHFPITDSPKNLAKDKGATRKAAQQTAQMLCNAGINWNLAPTADLDIFTDNPIIGKYGRSFSDIPERVTELCTLWIEEHTKSGILSCLKHFPGHGSSRTDSHQGFTDITQTWKDNELTPYRDLIHSIDAIMVGHLFNQHLDPDLPASLSRNTITGLLRDKMNYEGTVITDDMQMGAIINDYGLEEACCKAFIAGADMVITGNNLHYDSEIVPKIVAHVTEAVHQGRLTEKRLLEAYSRIKILQNKISKG